MLKNGFIHLMFSEKSKKKSKYILINEFKISLLIEAFRAINKNTILRYFSLYHIEVIKRCILYDCQLFLQISIHCKVENRNPLMIFECI